MTAETIAAAGVRTRTFDYRTCQYTGLKIDTAAQALIKANAVAAIVFLAVGGLMGLLVALTRWPAVHLLPAEWFYLVLTGHGANVLLFWIIFFEIAVLYFASTILLNSRMVTPKLAWLGFALMVVGAVLTNIAVLQGELERDVHILSAHAGETALLSRFDRFRGRRAHQRRALFRQPGRRQGRGFV